MQKLNMILAAFLVLGFAFLLIAAYLTQPLMFKGGGWAESWDRDRQHGTEQSRHLAVLDHRVDPTARQRTTGAGRWLH